jgi:hypothetical protein
MKVALANPTQNCQKSTIAAFLLLSVAYGDRL